VAPRSWEADPAADNARLLRIARELGYAGDLHVDEVLDASRVSLGDLARRVLDEGFPQSVTASHCVSLGMQDPAEVARTVALVARAGIGVVTLPMTNLYLMGRDWPGSPPRGLTALRPLLDAGVCVAAGGDNVRDPFNPMGRGGSVGDRLTSRHGGTSDRRAGVPRGKWVPRVGVLGCLRRGLRGGSDGGPSGGAG